MAGEVFGERVQETSSTVGTGAYSLGGASAADRQTFVGGIGGGNTCFYFAEDGAGNYEVGSGTITDGSPDTLSRDTIFKSSNADAAVSWGAGVKTITNGLPAEFANEILTPAIIAAATSKATPADADNLAITDSAASHILKRLTWANLKTEVKNWLDDQAISWLGDQTFKGVLDTVYTVSGTTPAIDGSNGGIQVWTLSGNSTPTDSMANGECILLQVDDGTAYTVTWTSLVDTWLTDSGSAPTLKTTGYTSIILMKQGGNVYGFRSGDGG